MATRTLSHVSNDVVRKRDAASTIVAAAKTFTLADSGKTFDIATDAIVMTLPIIVAANLGMTLTFRNTGADAANTITLAPNAADSFNGTISNAAADAVASGAIDKDFVNTKATSNEGDYITVKAIALTEWFITGGVGIWASQA